MKPYLDIVRHVLAHGEPKTDRTGTGTLSLFGLQARYDLREGFPLVTTKKVIWRSVVNELLWFLRGGTNIHDGLDSKIWDAWAGEDGGLGPIYGHQWRNWGAPVGAPRGTGVDQIAAAIETIKTNPDSRRIIVNAWNVADLPAMALPPCHAFFQFYVAGGEHLDCQLYQRSADLALGVPFNIASYSLLLALVANECGLTPRFFVHVLGDAHVYANHVAGLEEQLRREPRPLPTLRLPAGKPVDDVVASDIELVGYDPHPFIRFEVAV